MASDAEHTSAMVALVPTEADLDRLTLEGGEPREELHLTLYFLGEADALDRRTRDSLVNAIQSMVKRQSMPEMLATAFGVNHWNPDSDDPAWVLAIGDRRIEGLPEESQDIGLSELRGMINEAWSDGMVEFDMPTQHSPWSPHVTIAYSSDTLVNELKERLGEITFDRVRIAFGNEVTDVTLGAAPDTMTAGGGSVPWHKVHNHSSCPDGKPWAVVKDDTGEVEGCHASEEAANKQLAALYASEGDNVSEHDHFHVDAFVSDAPWNGSASRFTDEQYQRSCAVCESGEGTPKQRCHLPHHEPGGELSRKGVHSAAGRLNQIGGGSKASARSHLRSHYKQLGEDPPPSLNATAEEEDFMTELADAPPVSGVGPPTDDDDMSIAEGAGWKGVLVVEGVATGDGREFADNSLTWGELPVPLRWNMEDSHGGIPQTKAVLVGRIDEMWREDNRIAARGVFDLGRDEGVECHRLVKEKFLKGVSVDVDDVTDADVELIFPDEPTGSEDDDVIMLIPEKMLFHAGRIRAATMCDIPAFVEAYIELDDDGSNCPPGQAPNDEGECAPIGDAVAAAAVASLHSTETVDDAWDSVAASRRLPNLMPIGTARAAYALVSIEHADDEHISKIDSRFLHHAIDEEGVVGAANLTACSSGIGILNREKLADLSADERRSAYLHLAKHLRDAGKTPPPAKFVGTSLVAAVTEIDDRPPREWFNDPKLSVPTPITVTDAGRVYGHAAEWSSCHVGFPNTCVTPPEEDHHSYFMTGEVICADGSRVAVGQATVGTGHAPLSYSATRAAEHYDNTGTAVADVVVGNDEHGIWVAGAVRPHADAARVRDLRASGQVSGDWRRIGGALRLIGLLAVNVPGYPVPRLQTRVASGEPRALVAAGRTSVTRGFESEKERHQKTLRAFADEILKDIGLVSETESVDALAASAAVSEEVE